MALDFHEDWYLDSLVRQYAALGRTDEAGKAFTKESIASAIKASGRTLAEHYEEFSSTEGTSAYTHFFFDEDYYLRSKLAELQVRGHFYSKEGLITAIKNFGLTVEEHFQKYSISEGTSANPYFNTCEYLHAKLAQLQNNSDPEIAAEWAGKTVQDVAETLRQAGLTPEDHYLRYGCKEMDKDGNLINPSNAFDANAYIAAKLLQLQLDNPMVWGNKNGIDVLNAITDANLTPVSHFEKYGCTEANNSGIAMVQTVPVIDRVPNDPLRDLMGENVPANYNASSPAPQDVYTGRAVLKPADMGGLTNTDISPLVTRPEDPVPTPVDINFVALPNDGIVDTNENPVQLVSIVIQDAQGHDVVISQYGVATFEDERTVVHAVDAKSGDILEKVIMEVRYNAYQSKVTTIDIADSDGHFTQTITESQSFIRIKTVGTLRDGSTFSATSTSFRGGTTSTATITEQDGDAYTIASQISSDANGKMTEETTTIHYDKDGSIIETTNRTKITSISNDGSTCIRTQSVTKDAQGNVLETSSVLDTISKTADGQTLTVSKGENTNALGEKTTFESTSIAFRNPDGSITTIINGNSEIRDQAGDLLSVEVLTKTITVYADGSSVSTTVNESSYADGSSVTTHQKIETQTDESGNETTRSTTTTTVKDKDGHESSKTTVDEKTSASTETNDKNKESQDTNTGDSKENTNQNAKDEQQASDKNNQNDNDSQASDSTKEQDQKDSNKNTDEQQASDKNNKNDNDSQTSDSTKEQEQGDSNKSRDEQQASDKNNQNDNDSQASDSHENQDQGDSNRPQDQEQGDPNKSQDEQQASDNNNQNANDSQASDSPNNQEQGDSNRPQDQEQGDPNKSQDEQQASDNNNQNANDSQTSDSPNNQEQGDSNKSQDQEQGDPNKSQDEQQASDNNNQNANDSQSSDSPQNQDQGDSNKNNDEQQASDKSDQNANDSQASDSPNGGDTHDHADNTALLTFTDTMRLAVVAEGGKQSIHGVPEKNLDLGKAFDGAVMRITVTEADGSEAHFSATYTEENKWQATSENASFAISSSGEFTLKDPHVGTYSVATAIESGTSRVALGSNDALAINAAKLSFGADTIGDTESDLTGTLTLYRNLSLDDPLTITVSEGEATSSLTLNYLNNGWNAVNEAQAQSDLGTLSYNNGTVTLHRAAGIGDGVANTYSFTAQVGSFSQTLADPITTSPTDAVLKIKDAPGTLDEADIPDLGTNAGQATQTTMGSVSLLGDFARLQIHETACTREELNDLATHPVTVTLASGNTVTLTDYSNGLLSYTYTLTTPLHGQEEDLFTITLIRPDESEINARIAVPVHDDNATLSGVSVGYTDDNSLVLTLNDFALGADANGATLSVGIGEHAITYTYNAEEDLWTPSYKSQQFFFDPEAKTVTFTDPSASCDSVQSIRVSLHDGDYKPDPASSTDIQCDAVINPSDNPTDSHPKGTLAFSVAQDGSKQVIRGEWAEALDLGNDAEGAQLTIHATDGHAVRNYTATYTQGAWTTGQESALTGFTIDALGNCTLSNLPVGQWTASALIQDNDDTKPYPMGSTDNLTLGIAQVSQEGLPYDDASETIRMNLALSGNLDSRDTVLLSVAEGGKESTLTLKYSSYGWVEDELATRKEDLGTLSFDRGVLTMHRTTGVDDREPNTYTVKAQVGQFEDIVEDALTTIVSAAPKEQEYRLATLKESMIPQIGSDGSTTEVTGSGSLTLLRDTESIQLNDPAQTVIASEQLQDLANAPLTVTLESGNTVTLTGFDEGLLTYTYTLSHPVFRANQESFTLSELVQGVCTSRHTVIAPIEDDHASLGDVSIGYDDANNLLLTLDGFTLGADRDGATFDVQIGEEKAHFTYSDSGWIANNQNFALHDSVLTYTNHPGGADSQASITLTVRDGDFDANEDPATVSKESVLLNPSNNPLDSHPDGTMHFSLLDDDGMTRLLGQWKSGPDLKNDSNGSVLTIAVSDQNGECRTYTAVFNNQWTVSGATNEDFSIDADGAVTIDNLPVGVYTVSASLRDADDVADRVISESDALTISPAQLTFPTTAFKDSEQILTGQVTLSKNLDTNSTLLICAEENSERSSIQLYHDGQNWVRDTNYAQSNALGELSYANGVLTLTRASGVNDGVANTYTFTSTVDSFVVPISDPIHTTIAEAFLEKNTEPSPVRETDIPQIGSESDATTLATTEGSITVRGAFTEILCDDTSHTHFSEDDLKALNDSPQTLTLASGNTITLTQYENSILSYTYTLSQPLNQKTEDTVNLTIVDKNENESSLAITIPVEDDNAAIDSLSQGYTADNDLALTLNGLTTGADADGSVIHVRLGDDEETFTYSKNENTWSSTHESEKFTFDGQTIVYSDQSAQANTVQSLSLSIQDGDSTGAHPEELSLANILINPVATLALSHTALSLNENASHNAVQGGIATLTNVKAGDTVRIESQSGESLTITVPAANQALTQPERTSFDSEHSSFSLSDIEYKDHTLSFAFAYTQKDNVSEDSTETVQIAAHNAFGREIIDAATITCGMFDSRPTFDGVTAAYDEDGSCVTITVPQNNFGADCDAGCSITATLHNDESGDTVLRALKTDSKWTYTINDTAVTADNNPLGTLNYSASQFIYTPNTPLASGNYTLNLTLEDSDGSKEEKRLDLPVENKGTSESWTVSNNTLQFTGDALHKATPISIIVQENKTVSVDGNTPYSGAVSTINLQSTNLTADASIAISAAKNGASLGSDSGQLNIAVKTTNAPQTTVTLTENAADSVRITDTASSASASSDATTINGTLEANDSVSGSFTYKTLSVKKGAIAKSSETGLTLESLSSNAGIFGGSLEDINELYITGNNTVNLLNLDFSGIKSVTVKSATALDLKDTQLLALKSLQNESGYLTVNILDSESTAGNKVSKLAFTEGTHDFSSLKGKFNFAGNASIELSGDNTEVRLYKVSLTESSFTMDKDGRAQKIILDYTSFGKVESISTDNPNDTIAVANLSGSKHSYKVDILSGKEGIFESLEPSSTLLVYKSYENNEANSIDISNLTLVNFSKLELGQEAVTTQKVIMNGEQFTTFNGNILTSLNDCIALTSSLGTENELFEIQHTSLQRSDYYQSVNLYLSSDESNYVKIADKNSSSVVDAHSYIRLHGGDNGDTIAGGSDINFVTLGAGKDTFVSSVAISKNFDIVHNFGENDIFQYTGELKNNASDTIEAATIASGDTLSTAIESQDNALVYRINTQIEDVTSAVNAIEAYLNSKGTSINSEITACTKACVNAVASVLQEGAPENLDSIFTQNEKVLFALDDGTNTVITLFSNQNTGDNTISANELTLVGIMAESVLTEDNFG